MYTFAKNIRTRTCEELSFFINIKNNSILTLKTSAYMYLKEALCIGLDDETLKTYNSEFINFVLYLKDNGVLEN